MILSLQILASLTLGYGCSAIARRTEARLGDVVLFGVGSLGLIFFGLAAALGSASPLSVTITEAFAAAPLLVFAGRRSWPRLRVRWWEFAPLPLFALLLFRQPFGEWDAFAVYNLKAKFLAFGGAQWNRLFLEPAVWGAPDYPLLSPSVIAAAWQALGSETLWVPRIVSILFSWGAWLALSDAAEDIVPSMRGRIASAFFLTTPAFLWWSVRQMADVPDAAYLILGTSLFLKIPDRGALAGSGLAFGMASFTKNEGLLFAVIFVAAAVLSRWRALRSFPVVGRDILVFFAGVAPGLACWLALKSRTPSTFLAESGLLHRMTWPRLCEVGAAFAHEMLTWRGWGIFWPVAILYFAATWRRKRDWRSDALEGFLALSLAAVAGIFWVTPLDLPWHARVSLGRLLFQLVPAIYLAAALRFERLLYEARGRG